MNILIKMTDFQKDDMQGRTICLTRARVLNWLPQHPFIDERQVFIRRPEVSTNTGRAGLGCHFQINLY